MTHFVKSPLVTACLVARPQLVAAEDFPPLIEACVYIYIYIYMHIIVNIHIYIYIYIYACCMLLYVCMYVYIYIYIYIYALLSIEAACEALLSIRLQNLLFDVESTYVS